MTKRTWLGLAGWVVITFTASAIGALFSPDAWYAALAKPAWNPPNWVFGPVWTLLYALMALAAWKVWRTAGFGGAGAALGLYLAQLGLNAAWSWLFFGQHLLLVALLDLLALFAVVVATTVAFWRVSPRAGMLLLPYLAWLAFAGSLNAALWQMNPGS